MYFMYVVAPLSGVCILILAGIRVRTRNGSQDATVLSHVAAFGASFGGALTLVWIAGLAGLMDFVPRMKPDGMLGEAWIGAWAGVLVYVVFGLTQIYIRPAFVRWAYRMPNAEETTLLTVRTVLAGLFGSAVCFAILFAGIHFASTLEMSPLIFAPLLALLPLYQSMALPWFRYFRSPSLQLAVNEETNGNGADIQTWLNELRATKSVPRFHLRVQQGDLLNALAMGGVFRHLVVIGGGILKQMSTFELKGILAHEVAHVMRKDVLLRLLPVSVLASVGYMILHQQHIQPLLDEGNDLVGVLSLALYAGVAFGLIPGYVMRRAEYGADKLAVRLLGEREPLVQGLLKLAELTGQDLNYNSGTHPSFNKRIAAIRKVALPTDEP